MSFFITIRDMEKNEENQQRAILGGGCLTLIVAIIAAIVCLLVSILDKLADKV